MRTSTLQKLPVPFMALCGLGIGIVAFLLFKPASDEAQTAAAKTNTPVVNQTAAQNSRSNSKRYRPGGAVARLNRPGGNNYRPVRQAGAQVAKKPESTVIDPSNGYVPELKPAKQVAAASTQKAKPAASAVKTPAEQLAPVRREAEKVASQMVATNSQPTGPSTKTYTPENPDPSALLAQALAVEPTTAAQAVVEAKPTAQETDIAAAVEPPVATPPALDIEAPAASDEEAETTPKSSVVAGELTTQLDEETAKKISIRNPSENKLPVWFVANRRKIELKPGQQFVIPAVDELEVRFARGGELGADQVVMRDGNWAFSVTRQAGWQLEAIK